MARLAAAVLAAGLGLAATAAAEPPPGLAVPADRAAKARALVAKLGSPSYAEREEATAELGTMGRDARAALADAAAGSADAEVRARAARLLPRAAAADLAARLDAFTADADGKYDHDLPGWALFRDAAGADKAARQLFADILRDAESRDLVASVAAGPRAAGAAIQNRRYTLFLLMNPGAFGGIQPGTPRTPRQPTLPDVAGLLFAEVAGGGDAGRGGQAPFNSSAMFAQNPVSSNVATNPGSNPVGPAYQRLLFRWMDTRTHGDDLGPLVNLAQQLAAVRDPTAQLRKAVTTDGVQGFYRGQALHKLFVANKKGEAAFVRGQFKNAALVTTVFIGPNPGGGAVQAPCQLRDVALALLIADAGQNIFDYGFVSPVGATPNVLGNPYPQYGFPSDDARAAGQKKWAEWEAAHPPAKAPDPKP